MVNQRVMNYWADPMGRSWWGAWMGSLSPYEADLKNSLSSQYLVVVLSKNFIKRPTMSPATSATAREMPTQIRLHPATFLLLMKKLVLGALEGQRVGRSTSLLQYALRTSGETTKVPRKATIHILTIPKESVILLLLSEGYNFSQKSAEMSPAINPTAMAAPMFLLVPATEPHMMAPVMVPSREARIPSFPLGLRRTEKAQVKMTEALRAMKMEMKASCQRYSLAKSTLTKVYLAENMVVVAQKARNRKKVPMWARIDELAVLLKSDVSAVGGDLTKRLRTMPQVAAKRQTLLIWQSSKKRRSGEFRTSSTLRKWFRFQAKLNSILWKTSCVALSRPKTPRMTTSWAMALASAILRLQQSRQTQSPPKLYWYMRVGSAVVMVLPLKFVMKTLNQNFWKMGERMTVAETTEMLVAMAITVALLKQASSSPKPITTKMASTMKSPPSMVCALGVVVRPVVGQFGVLAFLISPAQPQTQYTPKRARRMMPPVALLDLWLVCLASLGWICEDCMGSALWFTVAISGFNYCLKLQKLLDLFEKFKRKLTHRIGNKDRGRNRDSMQIMAGKTEGRLQQGFILQGMMRIWGGDHSIFVIALHSVEHPQEGVAIVVVLVFQLLLDLLGLDLGPTALAEVHEVSPEVGLSAASQADVSRLAEVAVAAAAVASEAVALRGGVVGWLVVVAQIFEGDPVPFSQEKHCVLFVEEVVVGLLGFFLNAAHAAEPGPVLLPIKPVVGKLEGCVALPAGGVFGVGDFHCLHLMHLHLCADSLVQFPCLFGGFLVVLEGEHLEGRFLAGFGVAESGDALPLDAEQVISGELLLDVVLAQNGRKIGLGCCLGFFFFLSAGCCLRGVFLGDQLIDSIFEVDGAGVAAEVDLSPLVDKAHEGNAADGKIPDQFMLPLPSQQSEVLDLGPPLGVHPSHHALLLVVDADGHDPGLSRPCRLILLQHFLVVLHGLLAGPAPRRPHIQQQNFSLLVLQVRLALVQNVVYFSVVSEGGVRGQ